MCAKFSDVLVATRSVHAVASDGSEAFNDISLNESMWFRLKDSATSRSMQVCKHYLLWYYRTIKFISASVHP